MQSPDASPKGHLNTSAENPEEPWINSYDACHHLGISIATLHRWVKSGRLKPKRTPGGVYRFRRSDLNALLR
ncbi:MAG: helix-turn-helix domain-containing protein [Akkermansiaceae bacterium]|nr:helix-turn-helix domain-containing protein [Akkermansiaceae bacterium]